MLGGEVSCGFDGALRGCNVVWGAAKGEPVSDLVIPGSPSPLICQGLGCWKVGGLRPPRAIVERFPPGSA